VDLRTGLDDVSKRKFFTIQGLELQPACPALSAVAIPTELPRLSKGKRVIENLVNDIKMDLKRKGSTMWC
jgi:hypothetical protein